MKNKLVLTFGFLCFFGILFMACDTGMGDDPITGIGDNSGNITGYAKNINGNGSRNITVPQGTSSSMSRNVFSGNDYRSFPIDNQGESVRDRDVTVAAVLQFEREVSGYEDDPDGFTGYYVNHSSYPSDASSTGAESVYLVFDSRESLERYQVGYHHINIDISNSNLEYFEGLIGTKPISIFHVDSISGPTCWVIEWIPESEGGVPGSRF